MTAQIYILDPVIKEMIGHFREAQQAMLNARTMKDINAISQISPLLEQMREQLLATSKSRAAQTLGLL